MSIILIGNYPPDGQESMERFALLLQQGLHLAGHKAQIVRPIPIVGRLSRSTTKGLGKWLGYIDKWLIFPVLLRGRRLVGLDSFYHICDHSNSPYLPHLPKHRVSITCHDVLAIRGAFGYSDAYCVASQFGKILQKWILGNLGRAKKLATVSQFTMQQLKELAAPLEDTTWKVILNAFNGEFKALSAKNCHPILLRLGIIDRPYLLHVGSELPRKNRPLLLKMVSLLGERWKGIICYAGAAIDAALKEEIAALGLTERVIEVIRPDHETLLALYTCCDAFIFPSYSEGFGWPLIEAQACGAPVIASNVDPMPEVSGGAALHADPNDPQAFADAFLELRNPLKRTEIISAGLINGERFRAEEMTNAYCRLMELPEPLKI